MIAHTNQNYAEKTNLTLFENPGTDKACLVSTNNIQTTSYLKAAVRNHIEAERFIEQGNLGNAVQSLMIAQAHLRLASEALIDEVYYPTLVVNY